LTHVDATSRQIGGVKEDDDSEVVVVVKRERVSEIDKSLFGGRGTGVSGQRDPSALKTLGEIRAPGEINGASGY